MKFIIEGIDRLGKSTLIEGIQNKLGFHTVIHLDKPKLLETYAANLDKNTAYQLYQADVYRNFFKLLESKSNLIFDRGHLGECVYAPLYREYSGDYVFHLEKGAETSGTRLILLTTDNFDFLEDDGESFDFSKKEDEQDMFIAAFGRSGIRDKCIINVHNGRGGYRKPEEILAEALKTSVQELKTDL